MKKKKILFEGTELSPLQRSNSSFRKHLAGIVFQKLFDFVSNGMFIFFYPTLYFGKIRERDQTNIWYNPSIFFTFSLASNDLEFPSAVRKRPKSKKCQNEILETNGHSEFYKKNLDLQR